MFKLLTIYEFQIQTPSSKVHRLVRKVEALGQERLCHLPLYNRKRFFPFLETCGYSM